VELPCVGALVEPGPGVAGRGEHAGQRVLRFLVLGDRQRDALLRLEREWALAKLGAEARVRAQYRWGARHHPEEVRELASSRKRALQDRQAALGSGQLVVDVETALLCLHAVTSRM